jgi:hypothetical protein
LRQGLGVRRTRRGFWHKPDPDQYPDADAL